MEVVAAFQTEIAMLLVTKTTLLFYPTLLCSLTPNPHFHHDYGLGVNQSRRIYRRGRLNCYLLEGLNSLRWLAVDVVAINWEHILLWRPARFVYLNSDDDSTYNYNYSYYYANYQSNVGATTTTAAAAAALVGGTWKAVAWTKHTTALAWKVVPLHTSRTRRSITTAGTPLRQTTITRKIVCLPIHEFRAYIVAHAVVRV